MTASEPVLQKVTRCMPVSSLNQLRAFTRPARLWADGEAEVQLLAHRLDDELRRVAVEDSAEAVEDVDVAVAVLVPEIGSRGAVNDQRIDDFLDCALKPETTRPSAKTPRWSWVKFLEPRVRRL